MNKFLFIFFLVIFSTYVLFSRRPDYFDGQVTTAMIHFYKDSATQKLQPFAVFSPDGKTQYRINPRYLFRSFEENEKVAVIYESSDPKTAVLYSWWGYWITWKELLSCIVGYIVLFQAAKSITNNPTPEAIKELEDYATKPRIRKSRYK